MDEEQAKVGQNEASPNLPSGKEAVSSHANKQTDNVELDAESRRKNRPEVFSSHDINGSLRNLGEATFGRKRHFVNVDKSRDNINQSDNDSLESESPSSVENSRITSYKLVCECVRVCLCMCACLFACTVWVYMSACTVCVCLLACLLACICVYFALVSVICC